MGKLSTNARHHLEEFVLKQWKESEEAGRTFDDQVIADIWNSQSNLERKITKLHVAGARKRMELLHLVRAKQQQQEEPAPVEKKWPAITEMNLRTASPTNHYHEVSDVFFAGFLMMSGMSYSGLRWEHGLGKPRAYLTLYGENYGNLKHTYNHDQALTVNLKNYLEGVRNVKRIIRESERTK